MAQTLIEMNTKLRQKAKNNFEKHFFKLMNNAVFGKIMENVIKHRDIKIVKTERRRNSLVLEPNYHTAKFFTENVRVTEMKKPQITMNNPVYLELSLLDLSKTVMCYGYGYIKPKNGENAKLCYVNTDSFITHVKTDDIYKDIAEDVGTRFDTSNYEIHWLLTEGEKKKLN